MSFSVAVVGATGAVGESLLSTLEERAFPVEQLYPLASSRSAGKRVEFAGESLKVEELAGFDFSRVQLALFAVNAAVSAQYAPQAAEAGCVVIDHSAAFRDQEEVPLVVPEVNPHAIAGYLQRNIIASPGATTIQMALVLKPIHDAVGIERVNVATYQALSGSGKLALEELGLQTLSLLNLREINNRLFPKQIAFNALPQIDTLNENGYSEEEMRMVWETSRLFEDPSILLNPTAVQVPLFYGHGEAIHLETREKITAAQASELLHMAPGVEVVDRREEGGYPTAVSDAVGSDAVYVGRIREDLSHPRGLDLWVVSDNLRKGAALNSVQIAEILVSDYL
jgi:aspartate-semialdehyde dehydrogenase